MKELLPYVVQFDHQTIRQIIHTLYAWMDFDHVNKDQIFEKKKNNLLLRP